MTHTNIQQKAQGACDSKGLHKNTKNANSPTDEAINQVHGGNVIANQLARLALAANIVHLGEIGDSTVCKYVMPRYCKDLAELHAFSRQLGVNHG